MDTSTAEEWRVVGDAVNQRQSRMPGTIKRLLRELEQQVDGFAVNQLVHSLQTATRAERGGADEEMIVASLCHDIGKAVSVVNHPAIGAEIIKPYVSETTYRVILHHQDFQGKYYYHHFGGDNNARAQYVDEPWYDLACRFSDEWDQNAFEPDYETLPLEHFEPMIDRIFERPKSRY